MKLMFEYFFKNFHLFSDVNFIR